MTTVEKYQVFHFVEVGKWTAEGNEKTPADFDCTYYVALPLGYGCNMSWICAQEGTPPEEERTGDRKFIIHNGYDGEGRIIPFSPEDAGRIAEQINYILAQARMVKNQV